MKLIPLLATVCLAACTTTTGADGVTVACGPGLLLLNNMCQLPDDDVDNDTGGQVLVDAVGDAGYGQVDAASGIGDAGDADSALSDAAVDTYNPPPGSSIQCAPDNCYTKVAGSACACSGGGCYFAASSGSCSSDADCCPRVKATFTMSGSKKIPQPTATYDVCVSGECVPTGSKCDKDAQCWVMQDGLVAAGTCSNGSCTWPTKGLGESCDMKAKSPECAPTLACTVGIGSWPLPAACRPGTCDDGTGCGPGAKCSSTYHMCIGGVTGDCDPSVLPCSSGQKCALVSCQYDPFVGVAKHHLCVSTVAQEQYPPGIACSTSEFCPKGSVCAADKLCHQIPDTAGYACIYDPTKYAPVCGGGLTCVNGVCGGPVGTLDVGAGCLKNSDCTSNVCALCKCATNKIVDGDECTSDESCASGDCVAGTCTATLVQPLASCNSDNDCGANQACQKTSCKYDPTVPYYAVATVQQCVALTTPTAPAPGAGIDCAKSEFCALGDTCAPDNKCYSPTTKAGAACAPGAGCGPGLVCQLGVCVSGSSSKLAIGDYCTYNEICSSGACVNCQCAKSKAASGKSCAGDTNCVSGDCIAGVCK
jgi:hypothetical protein